jgi:excisionase family DNA binding protein
VDLAYREEFLRSLQAEIGLRASSGPSVGVARIPSLFDVADLIAARGDLFDKSSGRLNAQAAYDLAKIFANLAMALGLEEAGKPLSTRPTRKARSVRRKSRDEDESAAVPAYTRAGAKRALTIDESARAFSLSRSSLYELIKSGQLPDVKVAGRRLLPIDALEALIKGKTR